MRTRDAIGRAAALAPFAWAIAAAGLDACGQRGAPDGQWDAIVVAGCRIMPDGTPSDALKNRTALGVSLWQQGLAPTLILTGGVGAHPPSEAAAAARYAASLGVPTAAMIIEDASTSTEENARHAAARAPGIARVIVVTDSYHVFRAERVFRRHFDAATGTGSLAPSTARLRGALREVAAVGWYAVTGRL